MKILIPKIEFKNIDSSIRTMRFIANLILAAIIFKFFSNIELILNNKELALKMYIFLYVVIIIYLAGMYLMTRKTKNDKD